MASVAVRLSPKEAAYVELVKRMAVAGGSSQAWLDVAKGFKEACEVRMKGDTGLGWYDQG